MKNILHRLGIGLAWFLLVFSGCNQGSGGSGGGVVVLAGLKYSASSFIYGLGTPVKENVPQLAQGKPERFSIFPDLPAGLSFDQATGTISGTPLLKKDTTNYTVSAHNITGSVSTTFSITIPGVQKFCVPHYSYNLVTIFDETHFQEKRHVSVGTGPIAAAYGNKLFAVANSKSNDVSILDAFTNQVLQTIPVGTSPQRIVYGNKKFAVVNRVSNNISILDSTTLKRAAEISVGNNPLGIAYGNYHFAIVNCNDNTVSLVDSRTHEVKTTVSTQTMPTEIVYGMGYFAVINATSQSVTLVNATDYTSLHIGGLGNTPRDIVWTNDCFLVAVAGIYKAKSIVFIQGNWKMQELSNINLFADRLAFGNNQVAIISSLSNKMLLVNASIWNVPYTDLMLSSEPDSIVFGKEHFLIKHASSQDVMLVHAAQGKIQETTQDYQDSSVLPGRVVSAFSTSAISSVFCFTNFYGSSLVVDANTKGTLGRPYTNPNSIEQNYDICYGNQRFAITEGPDNSIQIIDAITHVHTHTIPVGTNPDVVVYGNGCFAVINRTSESISIIDAATLETKATIPDIGKVPFAMAYGNGKFAVVNQDSKDVALIDANTYEVFRVSNIGEPYNFLDSNRNCIAFGNNRFVVVNYNSNDVAIIDAASNQIIKNIDTPVLPQSVAFGCNRFAIIHGRSISILDATTDNVVKTISTLMIFSNIVFGNNRFCAISRATNTSTILDASTGEILTTLTTGRNPIKVAFGNGCFVVMNTFNEDPYKNFCFLDAMTNEIQANVFPWINVFYYPINAAFYPGEEE